MKIRQYESETKETSSPITLQFMESGPDYTLSDDDIENLSPYVSFKGS